MKRAYSYSAVLNAAQRVSWRIEDVIGGDKRLDFGRTFMPETLARVEPLLFLGPDERLALNQIRGNGYLGMFGLVEEFILPFVETCFDADAIDSDPRARDLQGFAHEEAKHIGLFKRFRREFEKGFGSPCAVIGPSEEIGRAVLAHHPLGVALAILHIEWMTQRHYLESVKDDRGIDPQFASLLRHHWMEEAQHVKLDTLIVEEFAGKANDAEVERATIDYLKIVMLLDDGLAQQAELDLEALTLATGRAIGNEERELFLMVQHQAMRWTFIGSGMTHPGFLASLQNIRPAARRKVERLASVFC
jgi:hypothetical protein